MIQHFCDWLAATALSQAFASAGWFVPTVQTIHILAIAAVVTLLSRAPPDRRHFAAVNMLLFHFVTARDISVWDRGRPPLRARVAGVISLSLWVVIVATGRWIGFTT